MTKLLAEFLNLSEQYVKNLFHPMKQIHVIISILLLLEACTSNGSMRVKQNQSKIHAKDVSVKAEITESNTTKQLSFEDSIRAIKIDTSTLSGKRKKILNSFILNQLIGPEYDSLLDLNYDGFKDYVIGYYGQAGTGIKNGIEVFLFQPKNQVYVRSEQLSNVRNPSFYLAKRRITGFYLGNGAGDGFELEWRRNKWVVIKEFRVDNREDSSRWEIYYPLTKKRKVLIRPYDMLPPKEILVHNF